MASQRQGRGKPNEFHVRVDVRLINKRSGQGKDKLMKQARDEFIRQLKLHVCALGNSGGGTLWIHIKGVAPSDKCLEYFHEFVDERLNGMIPDGSLFADTCLKDWAAKGTDNTGLVEFRVSSSKHIVTLDYKTKEPLDCSIVNVTSAKINAVLKEKVTFVQKVAVVRGLHDDMNECRNIQVKTVMCDELLNNTTEFIQYIWDDLKLKYCVSAFSKLEGGGSFYLGIRERKEEFGLYNSKRLVPIGFTFKESLHGRFISFLKTKVKKETTVLLQEDDKHVFTERDLIEVAFHPVDAENDLYVLEVAVAPVEGIVFYEREGPESYEVSTKGKIRRIPKERWYTNQLKLATGESTETDEHRRQQTENTAMPPVSVEKPVTDTDDDVRSLRQVIQQKDEEISQLRDENYTLKQIQDELFDTVSLSGISLDSGRGSEVSSLASWRSWSSSGSTTHLDTQRRSVWQTRGKRLLRAVKKTPKEHSVEIAPTYIADTLDHVYIFTGTDRRSPVFLHCTPLQIASEPFLEYCVEGELLHISPAVALEESSRLEGVRMYCATSSTVSFSPSSTTHRVQYWEAKLDGELGNKDGVLPAHIELGVSEKQGTETDSMLYKQSRSWCICMSACDSHQQGMCIQVWSHGEYVSCITNMTPYGESTSVSRSFGIILDISRGKLVFTDAATAEILKTFSEDFENDLSPVFGVLPSSDKGKIEIQLISGEDVHMTDDKEKLIYHACVN